jgi:hypothetical protein
MCSDRLIGVVDFIGGTSVVIVGAVASLTFIKPGDVLSVDSLIEQNMESFLVLGVELVGSDLVIELDRETQPEASLSFAISRLYDIIENKPGRVRLAPATLMLDGLDFDNPGQLLLVRKKPGGETMREEYESQASSGRVDFTDPAVRDCFDFDSDAIELVDRVKVTTYDKSDAVIGSHDQRHFDGDLDGSPHPSTPAPTTVAPTTAAPTTP